MTTTEGVVFAAREACEGVWAIATEDGRRYPERTDGHRVGYGSAAYAVAGMRRIAARWGYTVSPA